MYVIIQVSTMIPKNPFSLLLQAGGVAGALWTCWGCGCLAPIWRITHSKCVCAFEQTNLKMCVCLCPPCWLWLNWSRVWSGHWDILSFPDNSKVPQSREPLLYSSASQRMKLPFPQSLSSQTPVCIRITCISLCSAPKVPPPWASDGAWTFASLSSFHFLSFQVKLTLPVWDPPL